MENIELQKIWKSVDTEINPKSKNELNLLLTSKAKQTINRFIIIIVLSIIVSVGVMAWLIITSLNRQDDLGLIINNAILGIVTIIAIVSGILSWYKLQNNKYNLPLREWLEVRIKPLSKDLTGRFKHLYIFLIPFLYILTTLSIHVYYEYKSYVDVLKTEESLIGLIVGTPIGLIVAYYLSRRIRKYQLQNLEFLKNLYSRLCS